MTQAHTHRASEGISTCAQWLHVVQMQRPFTLRSQE